MMRWLTLRAIIVLILALPLLGGSLPARAAVAPGSWQVLGAAASLPTLYRPAGLAVDGRGDVYVADSGNFRVVEIGPHGHLLAHFGEADLRPGPGTPPPPPGQEVLGPESVAADRGGTVYVGDSANRRVEVFSPQHHLTADWDLAGSLGSGGPVILQVAVAVGGSGNVIVAMAVQVVCPSDCATYYIVQRRSPAGSVIGQFQSPIGASGQENTPDIINHIATTIDPQGKIYVATAGVIDCYKSCPTFQYLFKHGPDGKVLGQWGSESLGLSFTWSAVATGGRGSLFLADPSNTLIEKRAPGGSVLARWSLKSIPPGLPTNPNGVAVDTNGNVYVSDLSGGRVLKFSSSGKLRDQWGAGGSQPGRFWIPGSMALDGTGRLWVADVGNSRIQALTTDGKFLAQIPVPNSGVAMALDRQGNIYTGQLVSHVVYITKFSPTGKVLARWGKLHLGELPSGIAVAGNGDIYVLGEFYFPYGPGSPPPLDGTNILRLSPSGAQFGMSHVTSGDIHGGIAVDAQGNSYIAFGAAPQIQKRSPAGQLLATWNAPHPPRPGDFYPSPTGITLDAAGNIYIANLPGSFIQKFGPDGTLLGTWGFHGSYPGQFHSPAGIAVDGQGHIYVSDTGNHRLQRL